MISLIACRRVVFRPFVFLALGGLLAMLGHSRPAAGQTRTMPGGVVGGATGGMGVDRTVPTKSYHAAFALYYDGDYGRALDCFATESTGAVKTGQTRWIDSICYETMQGECYYQMGMYAKARACYTNALEIFQTYPMWLSQVMFPQIRADLGGKKAPPWQVRRLQAPLGQFPPSMLYGQGQIDATQVMKQGGVYQPASLTPVEAQEIVRCTALAIRRRGELLGPLAAHDTVLDNVIAALQRRAGPPNHWSQAWLDLQLGLALSAEGRASAALPFLQKATLASGELEHPLTAMAHLELGRLAMADNDYPRAATHFEEASYAAYYFTDVRGMPDLGVMEEAFRYGALNHLLANGKGIFPPLNAAGTWAKVNGGRQFYVSLLGSAAENYLVLGQTARAMSLLDSARSSISSRTMAEGRFGARSLFLTATALYQARKAPEGDVVLAKVMNYLRFKSLWWFQMQEVDNYYTGGGNGNVNPARAAIDLYPIVLRDPLPVDWRTDPMESLAAMSVPHGLIYEHWFEAAFTRKEHELAIEVADRARRHRFLCTLPLGGRLESLRWVLEGPKELLPPEALLQRQELLSRYPIYKDLSEQAAALRQDLAALPLVLDDAEKTKKQALAMAQLQAIGHKQELVLREIALRRDPAVIAFPPMRTTAELQKALPPGYAMLIFFATSRNLYAFRLNHDKYADWLVSISPQDLSRQLTVLLREIGNISPNYELTPKDLADGKWRQASQQLLETLLKVKNPQVDSKFEELIIVPDGYVWYVPFEALQTKTDGEWRPLISSFRIRYAPTAGLAMATAQLGRRQGNTAIVVGKFSPKLADDVVQGMVKDLSKSLPGCVTLKTPLSASPPIYANFIDRLVVLDDLGVVAETDPYGWPPLPVERTKAGGPLSEWFLLPRRGPDEVILPGFHSACENPTKKIEVSRHSSRGAGDALGPGNEIFLSVCGMMATGTRTILISRWRSGGQTSLDMVREFTQELPHTTPADAWQRAVQVVSNSPLNVEAEPRVKKSASDPGDSDPGQRATHPFFWAGYLLVDSGCPSPSKPEAGAGAMKK